MKVSESRKSSRKNPDEDSEVNTLVSSGFSQKPEEAPLFLPSILNQAREIFGAFVKPEQKVCVPLLEAPLGQGEINVEETLDEDPFAQSTPETIRVDLTVPKAIPILVAVDTSYSMRGEKLKWTAIALAVLALEFQESFSLVAFEHRSQVLKTPREDLTVLDLLNRFVKSCEHGYTDLEQALKTCLRLQAQDPRTTTLLLTDGKYTAGRDPGYLAQRFSRLIVVKIGSDPKPRPLCEKLASRGFVKEVQHHRELPKAMTEIIKRILRPV